MSTQRMEQGRRRGSRFLRHRSWPLAGVFGCWTLLASCGVTPSQAVAPAAAMATVQATAAPSAITAVSAGADAPPTPGVIRVGGMHEPESVLHDVANDRYLVSNINGNPFTEDDNGFIASVSPDGELVQARWIDGADLDVTLNAPKGMAIVSSTLYVADITAVRRFDLASGRPLGAISIPGATFLNDLVAGSDGTLYVSDSGLRATADGVAEVDSDAIYAIAPDETVTRRAAGVSLGHPNGLALLPDGSLLANTLNGSREVYSVGADGARADIRTLPGGQLDGLVTLPDGSLLVSSWETNSIYRLRSDGTATRVFSDPQSPSADIGYDATRQRVLIPLFSTNQVVLLPR